MQGGRLQECRLPFKVGQRSSSGWIDEKNASKLGGRGTRAVLTLLICYTSRTYE